jgi:AcrR family transcriptional regulator
MTTPRGRDAVRAALIETATRLFAERGAGAVGVREIAREANVNHGLIHRHFGSKDGLLQAVMQHLSDRAITDMGEPNEGESLADIITTLMQRSDAAQSHWRILARAMLDGQAPETIQERFPVYDRLTAAIRRRNPQHMSAEAITSLIMATGLGLLVFGPWIRTATGQTDAQWAGTLGQVMTRFMSEPPQE